MPELTHGLFRVFQQPDTTLHLPEMVCRVTNITVESLPFQIAKRLLTYRVSFWDHIPDLTDPLDQPLPLSIINRKETDSEFFMLIPEEIYSDDELIRTCQYDFIHTRIRVHDNFRYELGRQQFLHQWNSNKKWKVQDTADNVKYLANVKHVYELTNLVLGDPIELFRNEVVYDLHLGSGWETKKLDVDFLKASGWVRDFGNQLVLPNPLRAIKSILHLP